MNVIYSNSISIENYNELRKSVGWSEIEKEQALSTIKNSYFLISVVYQDEAIGLTRVINDGGFIYVIADVIVTPEFQGNGFGRAMMEKAMSFINDNLKGGQKAYIKVIPSPEKDTFYAKFGFQNVVGMTQWINK